MAGEAKDIAATLPADAWRTLFAGDGTNGERLHDWAYCPLADLDAAEYAAPLPGAWTRGLLIRRSIGNGEPAYFSTGCPKDMPIETQIKVDGTR